jgi:nucleotide-binding universal stress UspA family protein
VSAPPANRFTELVDWANGRVHASGPLTPVAADLLAGTAEQLRRSGHARVVVDVQAGHPPDQEELRAMAAVAEGLRVRHCELIVLWEEEEYV